MTSDSTGPGMPAFMHLDRFGTWVDDAFGAIPYMVGSAARGKTFRDVDVRLILPDERFAAMFPGPHGGNTADPYWSIICAGLSAIATQWSGLPVDFQIQSMSHANGPAHKGQPRHPLGIVIRPESAAEVMEPTRAEELAPEFPAPADPGYDGAEPASTGFGELVPDDEFAEINTTEAEFDEMIARGEPVGVDVPEVAGLAGAYRRAAEGAQRAARLRKQADMAPGEPVPADPGAELPDYIVIAGGSKGPWIWRCWGDGDCTGWVGLDLGSMGAAHREAARHVAEHHAAPSSEMGGAGW